MRGSEGRFSLIKCRTHAPQAVNCKVETRPTLSGGVGPVGGAESVVAVDVSKAGKLLRELRVVLLLLLVEAYILEERHVTRLQGGHAGIRSRKRRDDSFFE
jgi:hypothetical protein